MLNRITEDARGGYWIVIHPTELPIHEAGFHFTADGVNDGFTLQPRRMHEHDAPTPGPQLTSRFLRSVPFAELERQARAAAVMRARLDEHDAADTATILDGDGVPTAVQTMRPDGGRGSEAHTAAAEHLDTLTATTKRRGKSGGRPRVFDDAFYIGQAQRYVESLTETNPIKTVSTMTGYSESQVRSHIAQARQRGLLTPTQRGRPGGQLTAKAHEILNGKAEQ